MFSWFSGRRDDDEYDDDADSVVTKSEASVQQARMRSDAKWTRDTGNRERGCYYEFERCPCIQSDVVVKIVVMGAARAGKTSLIYRYTNNCFSLAYEPTWGPAVSSYFLNPERINVIFSKESRLALHEEGMRKMKRRNVRLDFWDIPDAERTGANVARMLEGAAGAVLVFAEDDPASLDAVDSWRTRLHEVLNDGSNGWSIPLLLVQNKGDLFGSEAIAPGGMERYCYDNGIRFWATTSAKKSPESVVSAFDLLVDAAVVHETKRDTIKITHERATKAARRDRIVGSAKIDLRGDPKAVAEERRKLLQKLEQGYERIRERIEETIGTANTSVDLSGRVARLYEQQKTEEESLRDQIQEAATWEAVTRASFTVGLKICRWDKLLTALERHGTFKERPGTPRSSDSNCSSATSSGQGSPVSWDSYTVIPTKYSSFTCLPGSDLARPFPQSPLSRSFGSSSLQDSPIASPSVGSGGTSLVSVSPSRRMGFAFRNKTPVLRNKSPYSSQNSSTEKSSVESTPSPDSLTFGS